MRQHLVSWKYHIPSNGIAVTSCGNPTSRVMEILITMANFGILHMKYRMLPRVSAHVQMKLQLSSTICIEITQGSIHISNTLAALSV